MHSDVILIQYISEGGQGARRFYSMWLSGHSRLPGDSGLANYSSPLLGISTSLPGALKSLKGSWNKTQIWTLTDCWHRCTSVSPGFALPCPPCWRRLAKYPHMHSPSLAWGNYRSHYPSLLMWHQHGGWCGTLFDEEGHETQYRLKWSGFVTQQLKKKQPLSWLLFQTVLLLLSNDSLMQNA